MSANNRYLRGKMNTVLIDTHGHTVVEPGDLMWRNDFGGLFEAASVADYYAYPFGDFTCASGHTITGLALYTYFLGVAMDGSPSGVTKKITVATTGVFKYPMHSNAGVTLGALVSAVSNMTTSTNGISSQTVYASTTSFPGCTTYLGYITKTQTGGASFVEFALGTVGGTGRAA